MPDERKEAERVIGRITGDGNPFDAWGNGNYAVNLPHAMSVVDASPTSTPSSTAAIPPTRAAARPSRAACSRT